MPRQKKKPGSALATVTPTSLDAKTITRAQANQRLKTRALERFHNDRARREANVREFEAEFGRSDRVDATLLSELQKLQVRLAAVVARQARAGAGEPKIAKYVEQIGVLIGAISAHLATERAQELFARVDEHDYLGWNGKGLGPKGHDPAVLDGYTIVEDPEVPAGTQPTVDEEGEVCLHEQITPYEDEPHVAACDGCGEEFPLRGVPWARKQREVSGCPGQRPGRRPCALRGVRPDLGRDRAHRPRRALERVHVQRA